MYFMYFCEIRVVGAVSKGCGGGWKRGGRGRNFVPGINQRSNYGLLILFVSMVTHARHRHYLSRPFAGAEKLARWTRAAARRYPSSPRPRRPSSSGPGPRPSFLELFSRRALVRRRDMRSGAGSIDPAVSSRYETCIYRGVHSAEVFCATVFCGASVAFIFSVAWGGGEREYRFPAGLGGTGKGNSENSCRKFVEDFQKFLVRMAIFGEPWKSYGIGIQVIEF